MTSSLNLDDVKFAVDTGTVVVVAQDAATGRVLMVAHADREALARTIETGEMHYRSRRRGLWRKGCDERKRAEGGFARSRLRR